MPEAITAVTISQLSHRLTGRHRTRADGPDIKWTLSCGYGFWRTDRTDGIGLRIIWFAQPRAVDRFSSNGTGRQLRLVSPYVLSDRLRRLRL
jgi:hypothetical protein